MFYLSTTHRFTILLFACFLSFNVTAAESSKEDMQGMQEQLDALQKKVDTLEQEPAITESSDDGVHVGGMLSFLVQHHDFDDANKKQKGDIAFDALSFNLDGSIGDINLSVEWRWYDYMTTFRHAWVGYQFDEAHEVQAGLVKLPFGNLDYNSHNYYLSSNYYVGLEDTAAWGAKYIFNDAGWDLQLAFLKNSARGVGGNNENYSFDLVGVEQTGDDGTAHNAGIANTGVMRLAYTFEPADELAVEVGASGLYGGLYGSRFEDNNGAERGTNKRIGNYGAHAAHLNASYQRWNFMLQASQYDYRFSNGQESMRLGAYAYDYETATKGTSYTANVAYGLPVQWGPISQLDFYNNYSLITDKRKIDGKRPGDTWMNVTGVGIQAGGLYTYVDYVHGKRQPFVGGEIADFSADTENLFSINVGYYF